VSTHAHQTRTLRAVPNQGQPTDLIEAIRDTIARTRRDSERDLLEAIARPLLADPDTPTTFGAMGRKLMSMALETDDSEEAV
jgi:hypothetical protein